MALKSIDEYVDAVRRYGDTPGERTLASITMNSALLQTVVQVENSKATVAASDARRRQSTPSPKPATITPIK